MSAFVNGVIFLTIFKKIVSIMLISLLLLSFSSCNNGYKDQTDKININVGTLKGPTGLGMLKLIHDANDNNTSNNYEFTIAGEPTEIAAKIANGQIDIGSLPTNMASALYNKTNSNLQILNINTLGVLYILSKGENINDINDLKGKTIYSTGQGATPEYSLEFVLERNNLKVGEDVYVEYLSEHSELATKLIAGDVSIAMLPEPFVTQVITKDPSINIAIDLTSEWDKAVNSESVLTMGCLVARKDFIENNKDAVDKFIEEFKASVSYTNENILEASTLSEQYNIMPESVAQKAIPNCNIVYIDGLEMKNKCSKFLNILYSYNPKSVGGTLPSEEFYY